MQQDGLGPFRLCKGLWRGAWDKPALTGNECGRDGSNARGITHTLGVRVECDGDGYEWQGDIAESD